MYSRKKKPIHQLTGNRKNGNQQEKCPRQELQIEDININYVQKVKYLVSSQTGWKIRQDTNVRSRRIKGDAKRNKFISNKENHAGLMCAPHSLLW